MVAAIASLTRQYGQVVPAQVCMSMVGVDSAYQTGSEAAGLVDVVELLAITIQTASARSLASSCMSTSALNVTVPKC